MKDIVGSASAYILCPNVSIVDLQFINVIEWFIYSEPLCNSDDRCPLF